jgi:HPt (histidine-containing phosphotransfer) domain-containing protein
MRSNSSDLERQLDAILSAARAEFVGSLSNRIALIDSLLSDLDPAAAGGDRVGDALAALRSEMHRIAGLCGSIGMADLSREGMAAEEALRPLATGVVPPEEAEALAEAREAVAAVRALLVGLGRVATPGEA